MKAIRIPPKLARQIRDYLAGRKRDLHAAGILRDLEMAMAPGFKPRPSRHTKKYLTRMDRAIASARLRKQVEKRAAGNCECCGEAFTSFDPPEWDHFFGRGKGRPEETVATTWMLRRSCHREKTANRPDAAYWLERFITHAVLHGHESEVERARARLEGIVGHRAATAGGAR
jgi:hypothetical protein